MKFLAVLFALLSFGCGCGSAQPQPALETSARPAIVEIVDSVRASTLALVDSTGSIYCSGVWLAPEVFITAAHCVVIGGPTLYVSFAGYDVHGDSNQLRRGTEAWVFKQDDVQDLALFGVVPTAPHGFAVLSDRAPQIRDEVIIVGHTLGIPFSYAPGYVDGLRRMIAPELGIAGEFLQVWGGAYGGNSGGGVWDLDGHLLGTCSFRAGPLHWFVSADAIRAFLNG